MGKYGILEFCFEGLSEAHPWKIKYIGKNAEGVPEGVIRTDEIRYPKVPRELLDEVSAVCDKIIDHINGGE
jgi:hypothetical protein